MLKITKLENGIKISNGVKSVIITKNDRWITVKPHGDEEKGRHLLLEGDETPKEAMERQWKIKLNKKDDSDNKKEQNVEKNIYSEETIKELSDDELQKLEDELSAKEFDLFNEKEKFVKEKQKALLDELQKADDEMNAANYNSKEYYDAWERYKDLKEKIRTSSYELEDDFDSNNRKKRLDLSAQKSIIWAEKNRRWREKQEKIKKEKEMFDEKIEDLSRDEYTMSDDEFIKAKSNLLSEIDASQNLGEYERYNLKKAISEKSGTVAFERKVGEIKAKVSNYSKNTDRLVEKLENFETFSQKYEREKEEYDEKSDALVKEYNEERDNNKRAEIEKEMENLHNELMVTYTTSKERTRKDVEMTNKLLIETFGDTGSQIETPRLKKGSTAYKRFNEISGALDGVLSKDINTKNPPKFNGRRGRANYNPSDNSIMIGDFYDADTAIHEYMHYLEYHNPKMLENSKAFLEYRTKGESAQSLNKLTGRRGYSSNEIAKKDNFFEAYCGKMYGGSSSYRTADATELMSMGAQRLFTDPKGFAKEDREYFDFVIANLRGEL